MTRNRKRRIKRRIRKSANAKKRKKRKGSTDTEEVAQVVPQGQTDFCNAITLISII